MQNSHSKKLADFSWIIPLLLSGMVYSITLCRTVFIGDSGEFSLVFKSLGIAHPPGYPLFSLLGHVFLTFTAFLKPAISANLLSSVIGAVTVVAIFFALDGRKQPVLAVILSLIWAFSPSFWTETTAIEVYGMNALFIVLLILIGFSDSPQKWYLIAYLAGLSLAHHPTIIAVFPALLYLYIVDRKSHLWKPSGWMIILFLLGLSVYLYLPVRASQSPVANWGHPVNLQLLMNHITGAQYQQAAEFTLSNFWSSLKLFFGLLIENWWWFGIALILAGLVIGIRQYRKRTIFILMLLVTNLLTVSFYRIPDIDPYYLPALIACFLLMTIALFHYFNNAKHVLKQQGIVAAAGIVTLLMVLLNFGRMDRSDYSLAEDYGRLILDTADAGVIFTSDDVSSFPTLYLRYAEGYKSNLEVYDKAVRFKALVDEVAEKSGRIYGNYQAARDAYLSLAENDIHFVKSYYPFDTEVVDIIQSYYSNGILFSSRKPMQPKAISDLEPEQSVTDFKSRQILVNMALCRAHAAIQPGKTNQFDAIQGFQQAMDYMNNEPRAALINQLGVSLRHLKQRELALKVYEEALQAPRITETEKAEIRFNVSNIYKDRGNDLAAVNDLEAAVRAYSTALEYDPENPTLLYNVGVIYINYMKQPQLGIPYLEAYLELNPTDQNVRNLLNSVK